MGDEHSARLSVYAEKLDADAKKRYTDKVALSGCVESLILTSKELSLIRDRTRTEAGTFRHQGVLGARYQFCDA
ncbi:hypothetical protein HPB52_001048 [Rhipicephalus sanguineus]|uniref:Uncharacterized protein n=1 Tax=Rhipicephalus sanguineus TaxID=34632 RepID=A0A9D4PTH6_RHISA|nr:hypothetical protein HPB52_001048 [Rhipicephalus sanguineus]